MRERGREGGVKGFVCFWYLAGAGDELQKQGSLLPIEPSQHFPEPHNHVVRGTVLMILGIVAQLVHVHIRQPADQQFQFGGGENGDQFGRDEFVETIQKRLDLRSNAVGHPMMSNQTNVLRLVLIGYCHVSTTRNQIHHFVTTKVRRFGRERQFQAQHLQGDLEDLLEGLVVVRLNGLWLSMEDVN